MNTLFPLAFAILVVIHLPYLRLPYFWDELGQFVPAALDLYRDGSWVSHTVPPNVHPPGVMALVALVWHVFGSSIFAARLTMLAVASLGVVLSFLLAVRLTRGTPGASAIAAVLFLIASPTFYTQSMLVVLDMPAMTFTVLALLLFLDRRYAWCAAACTILILTKETAITTPAVFAAWLWFRERRRRQTLYFAAPAIALGVWLLILHRASGHWLGNDEFARYNLAGASDPVHLALAVAERVRFLFWTDGHFLGTIALVVGWRLLRGPEWIVAGLVAVAQVFLVTVLGGPLVRYLLPALPVLYAAVAMAASVYPAKWRWTSHAAMILLLVAGWFWNPPYPFAYENNLSMMDFVRLQQDAASYLEANAPDKRIATAWPLTDELRNPDLGYVGRPLEVVDAGGFRLAHLTALNRQSFDLLVVYKRLWPAKGTILDMAPLRDVLQHYYEYYPQATAEEIGAKIGFVPLMRWEHRSQWIEIYGPMGSSR
jgi:4-amino-4-deoxy-L-arabinose transferase-like glycosyltransferase